MNREEIERKLQLAETNLRNAIARQEQTEQQLQELENQREAILGESEIARRARADFQRLSEQSRGELVALEIDEAREALAAAVRERNDVIARAATALDSAVSLLGTIDSRRAAVLEANAQLRSLDKAAGRTAPEEPDILHEPWQRMVLAVKSELDGELESDLVDAAARSNLTSALDSLPQHLRVLATERRRQMNKERLQRNRDLMRERETPGETGAVAEVVDEQSRH